MIDRTVGLVVEREVREAARRKGVWALVALVFVGATAMVVLPEVVPDGPSRGEVAVVGDDTIGLAEALEAVPEPDITVTARPDRAAAVAAMEEGDADLIVVLPGPGDGAGATDAPEILVEDEASDLVAVVREVVISRVAATRLAAAGIDLAQVSEAFSGAEPTISLVDAERPDRQGAAFALTMVLYLVTVLLTSQVAAAVATEKSNRVSEVLLAIVPPSSLLAGKVIGISCIGAFTLLAGALPVTARVVLGGDLPADIGRTLLVSSAWFLGGLALYLTLAGALGAMVARQEEAGAVVAPLTMVLVGGYIAAISAGDSVAGLVLGVVPLTSPMVAPYRVAMGVGSPLEYAASIAVLFVTVVIVARLGTALFRRAIVRTGERLSLRDVF